MKNKPKNPFNQEYTGTQRLNTVLTKYGLEVVGNFPQEKNKSRITNTDFVTRDMDKVHKLARKINGLNTSEKYWSIEILPTNTDSDMVYRLTGRKRPLGINSFNSSMNFTTIVIENYLSNVDSSKSLVPATSDSVAHSNYEGVIKILKRQGFADINPVSENDKVSITFTAKNDIILQKLAFGLNKIHNYFNTLWTLYVEGKTDRSYLFKLETQTSNTEKSISELENNLINYYSNKRKYPERKADLRSNGEHKTYVDNDNGFLPRNGHTPRR